MHLAYFLLYNIICAFSVIYTEDENKEKVELLDDIKKN